MKTVALTIALLVSGLSTAQNLTKHQQDSLIALGKCILIADMEKLPELAWFRYVTDIDAYYDISHYYGDKKKVKAYFDDILLKIDKAYDSPDTTENIAGMTYKSYIVDKSEDSYYTVYTVCFDAVFGKITISQYEKEEE